MQGIQTQRWDLEVRAQSNAVLTSSNSEVMSQLAHISVTMNTMQAQLKALVSKKNKQARTKRKHYSWSCRSNYTHGRKNFSPKKAVHQDESYYNKRIGGSEKGREWRLGVIFNKIEIINPKISLINFIDTPPNPNSNNIISIADSGANIHLEKQATPPMDPEFMEYDMKARLPDVSTMESTHISTLQLPGISKQVRQIHISPQNADIPINVVRSFIWWWIHHNTRQTRNINPE